MSELTMAKLVDADDQNELKSDKRASARSCEPCQPGAGTNWQLNSLLSVFVLPERQLSCQMTSE